MQRRCAWFSNHTKTLITDELQAADMKILRGLTGGGVTTDEKSSAIPLNYACY
jgi:hypothetical protein